MSAAGTVAILTDRIVSLPWLLLSVGSHGSGNGLQDPDAMDLLVSLFVDKPQAILAVAVAFIAGDLALRFRWPGLARRPAAAQKFPAVAQSFLVDAVTQQLGWTAVAPRLDERVRLD